MKDPHEETIRGLIEYVLEEGRGIWINLPKIEASRRISKMVYDLIVLNGYRFEK